MTVNNCNSSNSSANSHPFNITSYITSRSSLELLRASKSELSPRGCSLLFPPRLGSIHENAVCTGQMTYFERALSTKQDGTFRMHVPIDENRERGGGRVSNRRIGDSPLPPSPPPPVTNALWHSNYYRNRIIGRRIMQKRGGERTRARFAFSRISRNIIN